MNAVDIVILVILAAGLLSGLRRGFVLQVATILGAVVALAVACADYAQVRDALLQVAPHSGWITVISYLAVFLAVWAAIILVARRIRWLVRLLLLGTFDRLGGAVLGLVQAALVVELLVYLGRRQPDHTLRRQIGHSLLAPTFVHLIPVFSGLFPHITT